MANSKNLKMTLKVSRSWGKSWSTDSTLS